MAKKIVITGAEGNIGVHIARRLAGRFDVVNTFHNRHPDRLPAEPLDIADPAAVDRLIDRVSPDAVVNAAAIADVNRCESEPDRARRVNVDGAVNVARACRRVGAYLVHFSTDLVFDGKKGMYTESDPVNPVSVYGATKADAEAAVLAENDNASVLRSAIVYGTGSGARPTFFEFAAERARRGDTVKVFNDEFRSFLYIEDPAAAVEALIGAGTGGICHAGGEWRVNRYDFVVEALRFLGLAADTVEPIRIADLNGHAPRPADCSLDSGRLTRETGWRPTPFAAGMAKFKTALGL